MAVVPAISGSSINAVTDPNVREVLRAMADGIGVRNGDSGNGDNAFLTLASLKPGSPQSLKTSNAIASSIANGLKSDVPAMQALAAALQSSILQSAAWQNMFSLLTLISSPSDIAGSFASKLEQAAQATGYAIQNATTVTATPNDVAVLAQSGVYAQVGDSVSASVVEAAYRVNSDNAINLEINTIWASVGENAALIQNVQSAVANSAGATATQLTQLQAAIDDPGTGLPISSAVMQQAMTVTNTKVAGLSAQWGVKIDLSTPGQAYVTGVSLNSAVDVTGLTSSSFIVLADTFAVGAPGHPEIVPFAIDAKTGLVSINGNLIALGSITGTQLQANSVGTGQLGLKVVGGAQIDDLSVGTLQIADQSVTVPMSVSGSGTGTFTGTSNYYMSEIGAATLMPAYPYAAKVSILITWQTGASGGGGNTRVEVHMDGAVVLAQSDSAINNYTGSHVASAVVSVSPGTHTFTLWFGNDWPGGGTWWLDNWSLTVTGVMK
jgi:hypothetical protein